jgi:hypothetical protein
MTPVPFTRPTIIAAVALIDLNTFAVGCRMMTG